MEAIRTSKEIKRVRRTSERFCTYCSPRAKKSNTANTSIDRDFSKEETQTKTNFKNILKIIDRNAKKLIQLTNDILDVTKIETNNLTLDKESFNLNDLISDIVEDYKDQIKIKHIKLKHEFIYFDKNNNGEEQDKKNETEEKQ